MTNHLFALLGDLLLVKDVVLSVLCYHSLVMTH